MSVIEYPSTQAQERQRARLQLNGLRAKWLALEAQREQFLKEEKRLSDKANEFAQKAWSAEEASWDAEGAFKAAERAFYEKYGADHVA